MDRPKLPRHRTAASPNSDADASDNTPWALLVPNATYDLVGRIIPGTVVASLLLPALGPTTIWTFLPKESWFVPVIVVVLGYSLGFLGDVIADQTVDRVLARFYGTHFAFWSNLKEVTHQRQHANLRKMWAERVALWNLSLGTLTLALTKAPILTGLSVAFQIAACLLLLLCFLRWDWTCRAAARTWAENWVNAYGPFKPTGQALLKRHRK